jgi:hypothetical protein
MDVLNSNAGLMVDVKVVFTSKDQCLDKASVGGQTWQARRDSANEGRPTRHCHVGVMIGQGKMRTCIMFPSRPASTRALTAL